MAKKNAAARERSARLIDVATRAGVSVSVASKVLNHTRANVAVSPETRRRVEELARELGYQPHAAAQELVRGRTQTVGLVARTEHLIDLSSAPYLARIISEAVVACRARDWGLMLFTVAGGAAGEPHPAVAAWRGGRVRGLLLPISDFPAELLAEIDACGVPYVGYLGKSSRYLPRNQVLTDHEAVSRQATGHLIARGHRRLAFLHFPIPYEMESERHAGVEAGCQAAGCTLRKAGVELRSGAPEAVNETVAFLRREFLAGPQRPTGFVCDQAWIGALLVRAARQEGLSVPGELSLISLDDGREAIFGDPALSAFSQAPCGEGAVELLERRMTTGQDQPVLRLTGQLIERDSVAPPPAN